MQNTIIPQTNCIKNSKPVAGHTLLAPRASTSENVLWQLSGNMTNNLFFSLHTHSETVTVLKG